MAIIEENISGRWMEPFSASCGAYVHESMLDDIGRTKHAKVSRA